jgi:PST family polysaccharide transporter
VRPGEIAHNVSRGAFYLAVEKATALVSGIAYFALLSRWLGPTKYGIMTLALAFTGLATLVTGNFEVYLERYVAEYQARAAAGALRRALALVVALKLALGLLASLVLLALAPLLARQFDMPELAMLLPVLVCMVAFDGLSTAGRATLHGLQRFRGLSLVAVVFHVAKTVMVGLMWYLEQGLPALAVGLTLLTVAQGLATLALPLWILHGLPRSEPRPAGPPLLGSVLRYCMPLLGARVTFMSGQNLSKVVLGKLFDSTQLGYFSFAFQTVERFVELGSVLSSALLPSFTHLVARGERARLHGIFDQAHRLVQVVACAISFTLFVFAHEITVLWASPLFEPAVPLLRVLALVPAVRIAQQPLTMLYQALGRPGAVLGLALVKFVGEFGAYFLLVPALSISGAAWSNLVGAAAAYAASLVVMARLVPEGAAERARHALAGLGLLVPLLVAGLALALLWPGPLGIAGRALLVPVAVFAVFAGRLVVRHDLAKFSALRLEARALSRARDAAVAGALWLAARFERRPA